MSAATPGPKYTGWWLPPAAASSAAGRATTARVYVNGTVVATASSALFAVTGAFTSSTTMTAGTGLTVTTGNGVVTAGDLRITAGNERLGVISTFAMTEPTSAVVMKAGTAPAGAITTSGGIFSSSTVVRKIIAAGTVSNVET